MKRPLYLDYHATTPVDPRVLAAMEPFWSEEFGNPSSRQHAYGWSAEKAVETAREQIANLIGAMPKEIYFTSGGTEANNLALRGFVEALNTPLTLITSPTEHKSVYETAKFLQEKKPVALKWVDVDTEGSIGSSSFESCLATPGEKLVSLMWANNEIGTIHPIELLAKKAKDFSATFHTDGVQALGHHAIDVRTTPVDLLTLSAHKIYGPKGIGALYIRKKSPRLKLAAQILGGGHELGVRSGTLNVPGIVGFGKACEIMAFEGLEEARRLSELRNYMLDLAKSKIPNTTLLGAPGNRLCNNLSLLFEGIRSADLLGDTLGTLAMSTGSACLSLSGGTLGGGSHVLKAIGLSDAQITSAVRFGLGRPTSKEDVENAVSILAKAVERRKK